MADASATPARLKVAVDVDEVLGRFVDRLCTFCRRELGWQYTVADFFSYDFMKVWKCTQEESNAAVNAFFASPDFLDGLEPIPGARAALEKLSETCDLMIVTSRQHILEELTLAWLDKHYGGLFKQVYFGNHVYGQDAPPVGTSRKKSDICRSAGALVLIDDNPGYATDCAEAGLNVLLFDWNSSYPWSKMPEGSHSLITVVKDWDDVQKHIQALAVTLCP